ncbi:MAG: hypothetical protein JWM14_2310 [Chitinophagaceae bacterium]|nr:hypothetical protein [Chitinophagaceae bacterium]
MKSSAIVYFYLLSCSILFVSCEEKQEEQTNTVYYGDYSFYKKLDTTATLAIDGYVIDLDGDQLKDSIILEEIKDLAGDPQLYTMMTIKLGNNKNYVIKNISGELIPYHISLPLPNKLKSDMLYIPQTGKGENYFFVWDYQYPDGTALLTVLSLDKQGVHTLYESNFYIKEISDLNGDGKPDLVGRSHYETGSRRIDSLDASVYLYQPYQVLKREHDEFIVDSSLTKTYNAAHYIFEGFKDDDSIYVLIPADHNKPSRIALPDSIMDNVRGAG